VSRDGGHLPAAASRSDGGPPSSFRSDFGRADKVRHSRANSRIHPTRGAQREPEMELQMSQSRHPRCRIWGTLRGFESDSRPTSNCFSMSPKIESVLLRSDLCGPMYG